MKNSFFFFFDDIFFEEYSERNIRVTNSGDCLVKIVLKLGAKIKKMKREKGKKLHHKMVKGKKQIRGIT